MRALMQLAIPCPIVLSNVIFVDGMMRFSGRLCLNELCAENPFINSIGIRNNINDCMQLHLRIFSQLTLTWNFVVKTAINNHE